jgi:hypothetical protein
MLLLKPLRRSKVNDSTAWVHQVPAMSNGDNDGVDSLSELATDIASAIPSIDAETEGQYGAGLGSESEERQIDLILNFLAEQDTRYSAVEREVTYPDRTASCDIVLSDGLPVEAKLLRSGDPTEILSLTGTSTSSVRSTRTPC